MQLYHCSAGSLLGLKLLQSLTCSCAWCARASSCKCQLCCSHGLGRTKQWPCDAAQDTKLLQLINNHCCTLSSIQTDPIS